MTYDFIRYERQIQLQGFGVAAQERIKQSHILIVGVGGLGSPAALYLAAAGIGCLTLVDDDIVSLSNLQRQIIHSTSSINQQKVLSAKERLITLNPHVTINTVANRFDASQLHSLIMDANIVLDCSDNFKTHYAINAACVSLKKVLIAGAVNGFDGQLALFDFTTQKSPCYNCLFPEQNAVEDENKSIFGPTSGVIGTLQAGEALKVIAQTNHIQPGQILSFDGLTLENRLITFSKSNHCNVCNQP